MKAAVVNVLGEAPKYQSFADPVARDGEALIKVRATGLHQLVRARASGAHYSSEGVVPMVPGVDGVGTLEDGRRVYFGFPRAPFGSMAEWTVAPKGILLPLPDGIEDAQAAAIANPGMSGWVALKIRAGLKAGETVLILGATGVAGQLAIQTARLLGAKRVIGVGRNVEAIAAAELDAVIALGDDEKAVKEAFAAEAARGIDVVIDYLWGRPTELLLEALATGFDEARTQQTRLVEVGSMAGRTITLQGAILRSIDLRMMGSGFGAASLKSILGAIGELLTATAEGKLKVEVEAAPLKEVESVWNRLERGRRIVFTV